jgi:hypothetical protein
VIPLSPYMRKLWWSIERTTLNSVNEHAAIMRRGLRRKPQVIAALSRATGNPFVAARAEATVQEQGDFKPRLLSQYDPQHLWLDPRGYRLSDRIWRTNLNTRRKIDLYLEEGIREGRGSLAMAADLEAFLMPNRRLRTTDKPYGTTASYDAMRLARTEITSASARAGRISAAMNPYVNGVDWVLSPQHGCCDICDTLAAGSPYRLDEVPDLPGASHPQCMCHYRWHTAGIGIAGELQAQLDIPFANRQGFNMLIDMAGPLATAYFSKLLLGWQGYDYYDEELAA